MSTLAENKIQTSLIQFNQETLCTKLCTHIIAETVLSDMIVIFACSFVLFQSVEQTWKPGL